MLTRRRAKTPESVRIILASGYADPKIRQYPYSFAPIRVFFDKWRMLAWRYLLLFHGLRVFLPLGWRPWPDFLLLASPDSRDWSALEAFSASVSIPNPHSCPKGFTRPAPALGLGLLLEGLVKQGFASTCFPRPDPRGPGLGRGQAGPMPFPPDSIFAACRHFLGRQVFSKKQEIPAQRRRGRAPFETPLHRRRAPLACNAKPPQGQSPVSTEGGECLSSVCHAIAGPRPFRTRGQAVVMGRGRCPP